MLPGKTIVLIVSMLPNQALADPALAILQRYHHEAKQASRVFREFSADRGRQLYGESCSECHAKDPRLSGRTRANKDIEPMAPSVNPKRFTDEAKVEKWFRRNCDDVFKRPCTVLEKGDFITYLQSVK